MLREKIASKRLDIIQQLNKSDGAILDKPELTGALFETKSELVQFQEKFQHLHKVEASLMEKKTMYLVIAVSVIRHVRAIF